MNDTHECKMCGDLGTWSMRDGDYTCPDCWALLNALDVEYAAAEEKQASIVEQMFAEVMPDVKFVDVTPKADGTEGE